MTVERGPSDYPEDRVIVREIIRTERQDPRRDYIYNALIVAAIVALTGALWTLKASVATLQTSDGYQNQRLDRLEAPRFRGGAGAD